MTKKQNRTTTGRDSDNRRHLMDVHFGPPVAFAIDLTGTFKDRHPEAARIRRVGDDELARPGHQLVLAASGGSSASWLKWAIGLTFSKQASLARSEDKAGAAETQRLVDCGQGPATT